MDPGILGAIAVDVFGDDRVTVEADLPAAVDRALAIAEASDAYGGVGVLITGSVVLVGDAKRLLA
jgi:dihydrofolate synthase/folylpolyglutamate synthase